MEVQQRETANFLAMMAAKEVNQAMGRGDICPNRVRASSAVVGQIASPARRKRPRRMALPF